MQTLSPYQFAGHAGIGTIVNRVSSCSITPVCSVGWDRMVWEAALFVLLLLPDSDKT